VNRSGGTDRHEPVPPGVPDVAELSVALERTASWLRRAPRNSEWNAVALSTLDELERGGPRRVTELAALERTSQPGMTGILARLAAAGLVRRDPDPTDGRATLITVTETGRKHIAQRHDERARFLSDRIRTMPDDDRRALLGATRALAALADSEEEEVVS
jgi:DNA-binding MarR family transcriptional regulator